MAEAVFAHEASTRAELAPRIKVDSCGTAGYHVGEEPDERTVETCRKVCVGEEEGLREGQRRQGLPGRRPVARCSPLPFCIDLGTPTGQ